MSRLSVRTALRTTGAAPWLALTLVVGLTAPVQGQDGEDLCSGATALLEAGRLDAAEREFQQVGEEDCVDAGLAAVAEQRGDAAQICRVGDRLRGANQADSAKAAYLDALKLDRDIECALTGLEAAGSLLSSISSLLQATAPIAFLAFPALLALALLAGLLHIVGWPWRRFRQWRRRQQLKVLVADVADDEGKAQAQRFAALLRDALEDVRILPPAPALAGTPGGPLVALTAALPNKELGALTGALIGLVQTQPERAGWEVNVTPVKRVEDPTDGFVLEVLERRGRTEFVTAVYGASEGDTARRAAALIYQRLMSAKREALWKRWTQTDGSSLALFEEGKRLELAGAFQAARTAYAAVAGQEPTNAIVRLRFAGTYELEGKFVDALVAFYEVTARWPRLVSPLYRIASLLSFADDWLPAISRADLARLAPSIDAVEGDGSSDKLTDETALEWAIRHYREARRALDDGPTVKDEFPPDRGGRRAIKAARLVVDSARLITQLQCLQKRGAPATGADVGRLERELKDFVKGERGTNWQVLYNVACFYARLSTMTDSPARAKTSGRHYLNLAFEAAPDGETLRSVSSWAVMDPDLEPIRSPSAFVDATSAVQSSWWQSVVSMMAKLGERLRSLFSK